MKQSGLKKTPKSRYRKARHNGVSLVELLVALTISGFLAICLSDSLSAQIRMSTMTQSRLLAAQLAKSAIDRLRVTDFNDLPLASQTYQVRISSDDLNNPSFKVLNRPLQIDSSNLLWAHFDASNLKPGSSFKGTVQIQISDLMTDTKMVQVTVTWREPGASEDKSYILNSIIHKYGIHGDSKWPI